MAYYNISTRQYEDNPLAGLSPDARKQLEQNILQQQQQIAQLEAEAKKRPEMPTWEDMREVTGGKWNRSRGLLKDVYRLKDPMAGQRVGLGLLQQEATRTGPSQWRTLEEARQADLLNKQGAGQLAQMQGSLAMRGGMRGGAGERMASQIAQQNLLGRQNIAQQTALADEQRRMQAMQQLPGAELAESQFQTGISQYNIDKALQEQFQKRASDLLKYQEEMRAWSAKETAAATPSSGGGGLCCSIALITAATLGSGNQAKAQDIIVGSKTDKAATLEKYEQDPEALNAIATLSKVRIARDTLCTKKQLRGYYKFSEATVPYLEKAPLLVTLGEKFMVKPIARLGEGKRSIVGSLWIKFWGLFGSDKPFVRSNGEIV